MVVSDDAGKAKPRKALPASKARGSAAASSATSVRSRAVKPAAATKTAPAKKTAAKAAASTARPTAAKSVRPAAKKATATKRVSAAIVSPPRKRATKTTKAIVSPELDGTAVITPPAAPTSPPPATSHPSVATSNGATGSPIHQPRSSAPLWSTRQLSAWGVIVVASVVTCFVGYIASAGDATLASQAPWINVAIIGLVVAGGANAWILVIGRRAIGMRRRALLGEPAPVMTTARRHEVAALTVPGAESLVADPGLSRYHRSDCALAAGRDWPAASRATHERAGRAACGVCRP